MHHRYLELPSPAIVAVPAAVGLLPTAFGGPAHAPSGDAPVGATSELARRPIGQRTTDESMTVYPEGQVAGGPWCAPRVR